MPGIVGILNKSPDNDHTSFQHKLQNMANAMQFEPSYIQKLYSFAKFGVYAGWVGRPHDIKATGPTVDRERNITVLLSGTSYSQKNLNINIAIEEEQTQRSFAGANVIDAYLGSGDLFANDINGILSGILVDESRFQCVIFNDWCGYERLFIYENENFLCFSSEAKALLAVIQETRFIDLEGLGQYLACGTTLGSRSLFKKIEILAPGSMVRFSLDKSINFVRYFDPQIMRPENAFNHIDQPFVNIFSDNLKHIVSNYTSNGDIGISLTGGLDSRMIMACLRDNNFTIPCYTFGSMYRDSYDVTTARKVAEICSQPHQVLTLDNNFLMEFENFFTKAVYISDGYIGFSGAAELYLNTKAKKIAPMRITGNFGGELLRGIRAFKAFIPKGNFFYQDMLYYINNAIQNFSKYGKLKPTDFTLFHHVPSGYGRYSIERSQLTMINPFLDKALIKLLYNYPAISGKFNDPSIDVIKICDSRLTNIPTDRGIMGNGPLLNKRFRHAYRELTFKAEYLTGHGMPKLISKFAKLGLDPYFLSLFAGRHKFQHFRKWIQCDIPHILKNFLIREKKTDLDYLIDFSRVNKMIEDHVEGKANHSEAIDKIVTINLLEQRFLL